MFFVFVVSLISFPHRQFVCFPCKVSFTAMEICVLAEDIRVCNGRINAMKPSPCDGGDAEVFCPLTNRGFGSVSYQKLEVEDWPMFSPIVLVSEQTSNYPATNCCRCPIHVLVIISKYL